MGRKALAPLAAVVAVAAGLLVNPLVGGAQDPCPTPTPTDTPTVTATATPTPAPAPAAWAWDARTATVDPDSASYMSAFRADAIVNPNLVMGAYAVTAVDASPSDPAYVVPVQHGPLDPTVRIPLGTQPAAGTDGHVTVRDAAAGREHDFWQAHYDSTTRRISSATVGVSFPIDNVNEVTTNWGGNAANTPLRRGLVTPEDLVAGALPQTLQFGMPHIGDGVFPLQQPPYRWPALHNAKTCGTACAFHMTEGSWVRLDPAVDVDALAIPSWERVIAHDIQDHGMILRDNSGSLAIYGRNGANWSLVGLSGNSKIFSATFQDQVLRRLQLLNPPGPP